MSEQLSFNPRKGFVALPVEIMDLDLTPGAFRTLAELCRMANTEGFCWPSLQQLSERLGRSRSAVSGYIRDLRAAGLVDTQEQRTANGYNYRLKYRVTFWQDWRASLRKPAQQPDRKTERSVQPDARMTQIKNHILKNHSEGRSETDKDKLIRKWARCFAGAPYPAAAREPEPALCESTRNILQKSLPSEVLTAAQMSGDLGRVWTDLGVPVSADILAVQATHLASLRLSEPELTLLLRRLSAQWPSHWQRPPTPEMFIKLVRAAGTASEASKNAVLRSYLKRWELAQKSLQTFRHSCSVEPEKHRAQA